MKKDIYNSLFVFLENAESEGFFGEISFRYRDGEIYQITKNESIKPEDLNVYGKSTRIKK